MLKNEPSTLLSGPKAKRNKAEIVPWRQFKVEKREVETDTTREGRREERKCWLFLIRTGMFSVFSISTGAPDHSWDCFTMWVKGRCPLRIWMLSLLTCHFWLPVVFPLKALAMRELAKQHTALWRTSQETLSLLRHLIPDRPHPPQLPVNHLWDGSSLASNTTRIIDCSCQSLNGLSPQRTYLRRHSRDKVGTVSTQEQRPFPF